MESDKLKAVGRHSRHTGICGNVGAEKPDKPPPAAPVVETTKPPNDGDGAADGAA